MALTCMIGLQDEMSMRGTLMNLAMALVSSKNVLAPLEAAAKGAITPNMWKCFTDCLMPALISAGSLC